MDKVHQIKNVTYMICTSTKLMYNVLQTSHIQQHHLKEGMMLNLSNLCYLWICWKSGSHLVFSVVTQRYSPQMIGSLWTTFLFTTSSYHLLIILSCSVCRNCRKCNGWWLRSHLKLYNKLSSACVLIGSQLWSIKGQIHRWPQC